MIFPAPLKKGDTIAIVTPATVVNPDFIDGAAERLRREGYVVKIYPHAKGPDFGTYAATPEQRRADMLEAWKDPEVRAILCARGGYGCVYLLETLSDDLILSDPKWLIGFSDVTGLHGRLQNVGIASIHSNMAKHLTLFGDDLPARELIDILAGKHPRPVEWTPGQGSVAGSAEGVLRGGNLAVMSGLADTPYDLLRIADGENVILFIEDISEAIYAVERMLWRLHLNGALRRAAALVVGQFTDYRPDRNHKNMEEMIAARFREWGVAIPVATGAPIGHIDDNRPLIEGIRARLQVDQSRASLTFIS